MTTSELKLPSKMTTAEYRSRLATNRLPWPSPMCWEEVAAAFGVKLEKHLKRGRQIVEINRMIEELGWKLERMPDNDIAPPGITPTLAVFAASHTTGNYIVYMREHVISIRHGVITDSAGSYQSVKRRVTMAFRVSPNVTPARVCRCQDPVVFGHDPHVCDIMHSARR
jgi:hypothetical protein